MDIDCHILAVNGGGVVAPQVDSWAVAWAACLAVEGLADALAMEALLSVRLLQSQLQQSAPVADAPAKKPKKDKGGDKSGGDILSSQELGLA